jgi:hypothetical protein
MNTSRLASMVDFLSKMNPEDPEVENITNHIAAEVGVNEEVTTDPDFLLSSVKKLHNASTVPARNYAKVAAITADLSRVIEVSRRPQYAALRPRIATIVTKLAGIFAQVDLADDISAHTLEEIQTAVHKLYSNGQMNKPSTYNFVARGKGHHGGQAD